MARNSQLIKMYNSSLINLHVTVLVFMFVLKDSNSNARDPNQYDFQFPISNFLLCYYDTLFTKIPPLPPLLHSKSSLALPSQPPIYGLLAPNLANHCSPMSSSLIFSRSFARYWFPSCRRYPLVAKAAYTRRSSSAVVFGARAVVCPT